MAYYKELNILNSFEIENIETTYPIYSQPIQNDLPFYYVYILKCNDGSYYTGFTSDLSKRIKQHETGSGCNFTKKRLPVELIYSEKLSNKSSALKREKQIKKLYKSH